MCRSADILCIKVLTNTVTLAITTCVEETVDVPTVTLDELDQAAAPVRKEYPRNREIMLRFMERQDPDDIAAEYGIERATVLAIVGSPLVRQEMDRLYELSDKSIRERLVRIGDEAVDTVRDTMRGRLGSELRFKAAKELLDKHPAFERKTGADEAAQDIGTAVIRELARRATEREAPPKGVTGLEAW